MKTNQAITLAQAAQQLGTGPRRLAAALRQAGILSERNIPALQYVRDGYFTVDQRAYWVEHSAGRWQKWYTVTLVTGKGLALLQEVIDSAASHPPAAVAANLTTATAAAPLPRHRR